MRGEDTDVRRRSAARAGWGWLAVHLGIRVCAGVLTSQPLLYSLPLALLAWDGHLLLDRLLPWTDLYSL